MEEMILDEINVKKIEYVTDESGMVKKKAKANFKSIGPKFGKAVQQVAGRITDLTGAEIAKLEGGESLTVVVNGSAVTIGRDDVEIIREDIQGWLVESVGGLTVALDTALTDQLIAEGNAREFVNRIQNMRKDAGFAVTDRIAISFRASEATASMLTAMSAYIRSETLAEDFSTVLDGGEFSANFDLNGEDVAVSIARRRRT
jgi:isoleucyl-tRNA synthetase